MLTHRPSLAILVLCMSGCGTVSNALFAEDLAFLDALPSQSHRVELSDNDASRRADTLLSLSVGVADFTNEFTDVLLGVADNVRALPPTDRSPDGRLWGPHQLEDELWFEAEMHRTQGAFQWEFRFATTEDGAYDVVFGGEHLAGETVSKGVGSYSLDFTRLGELNGTGWHGDMTVDYDNRDGRELIAYFDQVFLDQSEVLDGVQWYQSIDEARDFEFRSDIDINGNGTTEQLEVRTRWIDDQGGRSDAVVNGEDTLGTDWLWSQCFNRLGAVIYQDDSAGWLGEEGAATSCIYPDPALIEHI